MVGLVCVLGILVIAWYVLSENDDDNWRNKYT